MRCLRKERCERDRSFSSHQTVWQSSCRGRCLVYRGRWPDLWSAGAQRRGQIHHYEHPHRLSLCHQWAGDGGRAPSARGGRCRQGLCGLSARTAAPLPGDDGAGVPDLCRRAEGCEKGGTEGAGMQGCPPYRAGNRSAPAHPQPFQGLQAAGGHCTGIAGQPQAHHSGRADGRPGPGTGHRDPQAHPGAGPGTYSYTNCICPFKIN